ncbi:MAG: serine/threonine-protein kinase [Polaromonas sp.]|uniref:serine/threonine-protein kinase n=1 Tax=Polaromonas sp. TaxID=1869339 RepID=UPI0027328EA6|nr:serine/threonine-protein kinase [Polaromonas sp.]MDP2818438.1 serine/threonine-protein kinase [Polaromonas sp.]
MSLNKLGRYDIIGVLGKGAMGLVYEARDPNLNRRVAIKTIKVENLSEEAAAEYEARFKTEAHSAARLQHPNIVSVYDSDRDGDMAFLVMEFIQGEDLKHHLDGGKRYSLEQSLAMMRELLSALDYAHRQAIVHRDVKPANLLIEADGRVKLTDFGVARIQDSGEATRTQGSMVGTLKYMSPEQVQGQPIDARADLFAVGIVLYQLLTGKRPFDGDTDFAIIQQIVNHSPAAPSSFNHLLPSAIDTVVARALTKKRDQRFATAQEFAQALQEASGQASDPTIVPPVSQPGRRAGNATDTGLQRSRAGGSTVKMSSSGTDSGSTVTQELELVYWKDIKDSEDIEDLEGFLNRFPSGIYADLARRRLKKLWGSVAEDSGSGTTVLTGETEWTRLQTHHSFAPAAPDARVDADATRLAEADALPADASSTPVTEQTPSPMAEQPKMLAPAPEQEPKPDPTPVPVSVAQALAAPVAAALPPAPSSTPVPTPAPRPPLPSSAPATASPAASKMAVYAAVAGVAVLVMAGLAFKFLSGPSATGDEAAQAAPAAGVTAEGRPVPAASTLAAGVPSGAASSAAAATPASKRVAVKPPVEKAVGARPAVVNPLAVETTTPALPLQQPTAAQAGSTHPKQACENRVLLGFQSCMNEQCARQRFKNHPTCVERREQDKQRQEIRDGRQ